MMHPRFAWTLAMHLLCGSASAIAANCHEKVQEFALLAHMNMVAESVTVYEALRMECTAALRHAAGPAAQALPTPDETTPVLALGRRLHAHARDQHARQVGKALNEGSIPSATADALHGLGPENTARALWGAALDVMAAGLDSRQQRPHAQALRETADTLRAAEHQRWSSAGRPSISSTSEGSPRASQPVIALSAQTIANASCSGRFDFLAPLLRPYTAPEIAAVRTEALALSVSELIAAAKRQPGGKAEVLRLLRLQALEHDRVATDAAHTANATDGKGSASIPQATSDTLPLAFSCGGVSVHPASVCAYIANRWASLQTRASAALIEQCWQ